MPFSCCLESLCRRSLCRRQPLIHPQLVIACVQEGLGRLTGLTGSRSGAGKAQASADDAASARKSQQRAELHALGSRVRSVSDSRLLCPAAECTVFPSTQLPAMVNHQHPDLAPQPMTPDRYELSSSMHHYKSHVKVLVSPMGATKFTVFSWQSSPAESLSNLDDADEVRMCTRYHDTLQLTPGERCRGQHVSCQLMKKFVWQY